MFNLDKGPLQGQKIKYYDNGVLHYSLNFNNGKLNGLCCVYYPDGVLSSRGHFNIGKMIGYWLHTDMKDDTILKEKRYYLCLI